MSVRRVSQNTVRISNVYELKNFYLIAFPALVALVQKRSILK